MDIRTDMATYSAPPFPPHPPSFSWTSILPLYIRLRLLVSPNPLWSIPFHSLPYSSPLSSSLWTYGHKHALQVVAYYDMKNEYNKKGLLLTLTLTFVFSYWILFNIHYKFQESITSQCYLLWIYVLALHDQHATQLLACPKEDKRWDQWKSLQFPGWIVHTQHSNSGLRLYWLCYVSERWIQR